MYSKLLDKLRAVAEVDFAAFQRKLIRTQQEIIGVRVPMLRKIAKEYKHCVDELLQMPDVYYEVTFIKLTAVSLLPYDAFVAKVDACVALIDNWATCDTFRPKCLVRHRDAFLPTLERLFTHGGEFYERYVLVTLLAYYVDTAYLPMILQYVRRADTTKYYVHMAVAWLVAEILIKYRDFGLQILNKRYLDEKTHNKAIQKAIESYRITQKEKEALRFLKIK